MSAARFIADQRTMHRVPPTLTCAVLGVSISWLHKWLGRGPTDRQRRRAERDMRVRELFEASDATMARRAFTLICAPRAGGSG